MVFKKHNQGQIANTNRQLLWVTESVLCIEREEKMLDAIKVIIRNLLAYAPLDCTLEIREAIEIETEKRNDLPYCPPDEGDLLFSLIHRHKFKNCLELGFLTGSTALYMTSATRNTGGQVISISIDDDKTMSRGLKLLKQENCDKHHQLINKNSNQALPELFVSNKHFDFIFVDGWKTFDHLIFEIYLLNHILNNGGIIVFDDAYMPSVRQAISLMKHYYGYREINYSDYNQPIRLRVYHLLTRRSFYRPYRALQKTKKIHDQNAFQDWNFYHKIST